MKTPEELRESGLERTAFLIDRVTWRGGMACADHQAWYEKKRESWATLGLGVVQELLARISELEAENAQLRLHWQREARNASRTDAALEQAEAHAADCKRLVTACENDLDAERMKRREAEALVNANTDHMTEVGVELCRERDARIAELEALLDIAADTIAVNSPSDGIPTRESVIDDLRRVAARAEEGRE